MRLSVTTLATVLLAATMTAQQPADQTPLPKGQMPELGRPTKVGDELPLFNFDAYFPGNWTFEWDMPEGPLGPSGQLTGTTVYKVIEAGKFYEADTDATGPGGAFKLHEVIAYQKDNKALSRYVTDSRGFSYLQLGTIGGDLGGIYNIFSTARRSPTTATPSASSTRCARCRRSTTRSRRRCRSTAARSRTTAIPGGGRTRPRRNDPPNRWLPVVGGVMMNMALGMFYGMSVFMLPLEKEFGWTRAQTSWVSTIGLALIAVWYVIAGFIQDRRGPRPVAVIGGLLFSLGFFLASYTRSLPMFYLTAGVIAGTGSGFGYVIPTSVGSKWFPDKRGLVIGLMVGGYGAGSGVFGPIALVADRARRLAQHVSDPLARVPGDDDDRRVPAAESAARVRAAGLGSVEDRAASRAPAPTCTRR